MKYKTFTVLACAALLSACNPSYSNKSGDYLLPPELSDCKVFRLIDSKANVMRVLRCPNSITSVSYASGKSQSHVVTMDGI